MFRAKLVMVMLVAMLLLMNSSVYGAKAGAAGTPKNLVSKLGYTVSQSASTSYPDSGGKELTNGLYGGTSYSNGAWQGHSGGMTRAVTFDLGASKSISKVTANFLEDNPVGIQFPNTVSVYVSTNGIDWSTVSNMSSQYPMWQQVPARTQKYVWDGAVNGVPGFPSASMVYARYVKVTFTKEVWTFIDEIEVWGVDGQSSQAVSLPPTVPAYLAPGTQTGGIHDLVLLYNGYYTQNKGDWTKDEIMPYISYINGQGQPTDWMYDGVLYLGLWTPWGSNFGISSNKSDWLWYLDKTFAATTGDMAQLNAAAADAGSALGQPNHKVKVVLMIPYPAEDQTNFGDVDGDGISENLSSAAEGDTVAYANKQKVLQWYMNQVMSRWNAGNYANLQLTGMYWLSEGVSHGVPHENELIHYAGDLAHQQGLKYFWIPFFQGNRNFAWKELGFDAAALQPNHYFGSTDASRVQDAAQLARWYGEGIEMEFDENMFTDAALRQKYIEYLNGGVDYGYMSGSFKAYYQGNTAILDSAKSNDPNIRANYDFMYQFIKGTYVKQ